ncbi:MAG: hypothetical protein VSS75_029155 [Candidatus Parabeggiatoa sp.]|nr:hypothetical protein [Candidatus Parabeggiatoa sp.]
MIIVYRNLTSKEDPASGLSAKKPGRGMTPQDHVMNASRKTFKGSQFISTTIDPEVAADWANPGQITVKFDTDNVSHDIKGDLQIIDLSTDEKLNAASFKGRPYYYARSSKEVLVVGIVPPEAVEVVDIRVIVSKTKTC